MPNVSFGKPGQLRKTFTDAKFELQGGNYLRSPCALIPAYNFSANPLKDGQFLAVSTGGKYDVATDAARSVYMIFTANSEVIIALPQSTDEQPGLERSDTVTGLAGTIMGVWPVELLFTGARGGGTVNLASYAINTPLTVVNGKLCPANFGTVTTDITIGRVEADSTVTGTNSVACRISLL